MEATFFKTPKSFRTWLKKNHAKRTELIVGFYKVKTGLKSITWSESVDQAICYGWIDGIRRKIDEESYTIRFTPRRPTSFWSAVNVKKVAVLQAQGLMESAGLAAWENRSKSKSIGYSYENKTVPLSKEFEQLFKKNKAAWNYFDQAAPGYKKQMSAYVMTAKKEATRISRLNKLIAASQNEKKLYG